MTLLIQILMIFVVIATLCKLSLKHWGYAAVVGAILALFVIGVTPYAITQTKGGIAAYLTERTLREHLAIFISLEATLLITYCFIRLGGYHARRRTIRILTAALDYYPGLLIAPVLFYLLTSLIFVLPGVSFNLISYLLATGVVVGVPLLSLGIKRLLSAQELRLEALFIISLMIFILGVIASVDEEIRPAPPTRLPSFDEIAIGLGMLLVCLLIGRYSAVIRSKIKSIK